MNPIVTAVSYQADPHLAAAELGAQLAHEPLSHVLFFCSASYDLDRLGTSLNQALPGCTLSGCTTAGEITPDGYAQGSITAVGFSSSDFCVSVGFVEELEHFTFQSAQQLVDRLRGQCAESEHTPAKDNAFAVTLVDGLSIDEEIFLVTLNAALGSTPNFGGSAGDDVNLAKTHVFHNGRFHANAAIVLLICTPFDFEVFSSHHLLPTEEKLIATEADQNERTIAELNAEPAAQVYSRSVSIGRECNGVTDFALHPLAVRIGDEYFIRSIQHADTQGALKFFCAVENGIVLTLMETGDLSESIDAQYARLVESIGEPQIIIGCDCFLRRVEAEERGILDQISEQFKRIRLVGLNTYGEQRQGMHLNQTLTGVAIGKRKRTEQRT